MQIVQKNIVIHTNVTAAISIAVLQVKIQSEIVQHGSQIHSYDVCWSGQSLQNESCKITQNWNVRSSLRYAGRSY